MAELEFLWLFSQTDPLSAFLPVEWPASIGQFIALLIIPEAPCFLILVSLTDLNSVFTLLLCLVQKEKKKQKRKDFILPILGILSQPSLPTQTSCWDHSFIRATRLSLTSICSLASLNTQLWIGSLLLRALYVSVSAICYNLVFIEAKFGFLPWLLQQYRQNITRIILSFGVYLTRWKTPSYQKVNS